MKGLILAAGYGTRLYPLTLDRPKPLIKVGGRPILDRLLRKFEEIDACDEVFIVTNNKFFNMIDDWVKSRTFILEVTTVNDQTNSNDDRLGAIGDIDLVFKESKIDDDVLVVAGDNLYEFEILDFLNYSKENNKINVALYDIKETALAKKYGIVVTNSSRKVVDFQEKPQEPKSTLASTGIYYMPKASLSLVSEYMETDAIKDAPGNFIKWASETNEVYGFVFTEGWYDIGDKVSLEKADIEYRNKELG